VGAAYSQFPHTFIAGLLALMLAIQLISLGILSLQSKSYFEEMFHLGTTIHRSTRSRVGQDMRDFDLGSNGGVRNNHE
jgi:hypothetical protein